MYQFKLTHPEDSTVLIHAMRRAIQEWRMESDMDGISSETAKALRDKAKNAERIANAIAGQFAGANVG